MNVTGLRFRTTLAAASRWPARTWLSLVLAVALIERIGLWLFYAPAHYGDTASYHRLAQAILSGWGPYDGTRTPGYPLFLTVFRSDQATWLAQMALGIIITLLFFVIGWLVSGRPWFGGLAALAHTLNLGQLFFEPALLSETVTTFWVVLSVTGIVLWLYRPGWRSGRMPATACLAAGAGLAAGMAFLTRPLFIYLPFWLLLFMLIRKLDLKKFPFVQIWQPEPGIGRRRLARLLILGICLLAPMALALGGWLSFIHSHFGDWALDTMTGYHLIQHTGAFFEYAPDKYAPLRDTYIQFRDAHIATYGTQTNSIWQAIPAMQKASGLSFYDLSRTLARISVQLIVNHPDLYLRSVASGWVMFWWAPAYWQPEIFRLPALVPVIKGAVLVERVILVFLNLAFILTTILALLSRKVSSLLNPPAALWCLAGTVWVASIAQTFMDHGDNPRFLVPLQSLVVVWCLWAAWQAFSHRRDLLPYSPNLEH